MSNVKDLSRILADKRKLNVSDAEKFVSLMIDVINDGLHYNKLVKIKGLGTFKVTSVSSRESVDVNTGERIVIEGRDKISFTPDNAMKELVNRPFSQFETVVINDGVDLGQTEQDDDEQDDENSDVAQDVVPESVETIEVTPPAGETSEALVEEKVEDTGKQLVEPNAEEVVEPVEPVEPVKEEPIVNEEPVKEENIENVAEEVEKPEMEVPVSPQSVDKEEIKESDENVDIEELEPTKHSSGVNKFLIVSILLLFILSAGALYYMYNEITERNSRIESLMNRLEQKKAKPVKRVAPVASKVAVPVVDKTKTADSVKINKAVVTDEYAAMNNGDARVRTGAYKIVGVQKTIKVKAGQTLSSISRLYFGPGMECYIEVMNGKKELKEGDRIKIPELKNKRSR